MLAHAGCLGEHIGGEAESREQGGVGVMELSRGQLRIWSFYSMENGECSTWTLVLLMTPMCACGPYPHLKGSGM